MVQGRMGGFKDWERVWPKERIKVQKTLPVMQTKGSGKEDDSRRKEKQCQAQNVNKTNQAQSNRIWEAQEMNDLNQPYVSGMFQQILDRANQQAPMIMQYLQQNPDASDLDIYIAAKNAEVSPLAIAMATKSDPQEIMRRYNEAEQAYQALDTPELRNVDPRSDAFERIVKDTVENKAVQGLLLTNPYTAPIAPFVPAIRPVQRLFERWF